TRTGRVDGRPSRRGLLLQLRLGQLDERGGVLAVFHDLLVAALRRLGIRFLRGRLEAVERLRRGRGRALQLASLVVAGQRRQGGGGVIELGLRAERRGFLDLV